MVNYTIYIYYGIDKRDNNAIELTLPSGKRRHFI